jgi:hypothetical protein
MAAAAAGGAGGGEQPLRTAGRWHDRDGGGTAVMDAPAALVALEALSAFEWGDDESGSPMPLGFWPEAAAVMGALGPRLLECRPGDGGGDGDHTNDKNDEEEDTFLRLRVAAAMARALRRLAGVVATAAGAGVSVEKTGKEGGQGGEDSDDEEEEEEEEENGRRRRRRRLSQLRASVLGLLQSLLNAALADASRERRQALFAHVLMGAAAASSAEEEGGGEEEGEEEGCDGGRCLDPFLAAPAPVMVLLQAARDGDLEVRFPYFCFDLICFVLGERGPDGLGPPVCLPVC